MVSESQARKEFYNMKNDLLRILKSLAYKRRERSLIDLGKHDLEYEKAMGKVVELGKQKEALELAPEAAETIDELLEAFDTAEMEQVNLAYLAGMADCLLILDRLELFPL